MTFGAVVLAAGESRRMGRHNKLVADIDGTQMIRRVLDTVCGSRARPVIVVTGYQDDEVRAAASANDVTFVHNPEFRQGISTSLRRGIRALPGDVAGAVVFLGDMPWVSPVLVDRLVAAFDPDHGVEICVPVYRGRRGNPVLWSSRFLPELANLSGDAGGRGLLATHAALVGEVASEDDGVLADLDTPGALKKQVQRGQARDATPSLANSVSEPATPFGPGLASTRKVHER